jgi:hypothetical protein
MTATAKQRHGCLTAFLILMIIANSILALIYLFGSGTIAATLPDAPKWVFPALGVACILNVVFAVALFAWKRWGFYGFAAMSVLSIVINMFIGLGVGQSFSGLIGVAVLYGVLQIGGDRKGWAQLE